MNRKQLISRLRYYFQYFPFTINTVLCGVAIWLMHNILYKPVPKGEDPSPMRPFIVLMGKIAFWFVLGLIIVSVLSTFASWLYYLWLRKNKNIKLQISFTTETKEGKKSKLYMNALLEGVRRPILGFVKGRLFYDDQEMTDKFSLLSNKRKEQSLWRAAITGRSRMELPDIKEYQLKGGFIFFQDMLHLFSLSVAQPIGGQFYQPPVPTTEEDQSVFPKKTETMDVRIEQLRRVEGEHTNYKDYESGDDIRRIVWKVYARSRELVVRTPEIFEPYASHLYFYASFHAAVKAQWMGDAYLKEMLNYYKNNTWTVYETLSKKEWEMRYIPDQSLTVAENINENEKTARIISNSNWQTDKPLDKYFNPRQGAVLCISSLNDPEEVRNMLDQCNASTVVYFVKVSQVFRHLVALNWLRRIVFLPPKDRLSKLRSTWVFSPMRIQLHKREKEIEEILKRSSVTSTVL